jgi:hypothetical protein
MKFRLPILNRADIAPALTQVIEEGIAFDVRPDQNGYVCKDGGCLMYEVLRRMGKHEIQGDEFTQDGVTWVMYNTRPSAKAIVKALGYVEPSIQEYLDQTPAVERYFGLISEIQEVIRSNDMGYFTAPESIVTILVAEEAAGEPTQGA